MTVLLPLELLAMWLYMRAIRDCPLSLTLPYPAFTPVFNVLTGYVFLGETVMLTGFTGDLLVVCGAWLLNLDAARNRSRLNVMAVFRAITQEHGSRLMLMTAAIYSLTSVMGKSALQHVTPGFFGPFYIVVLGAVTAVVFASGDVTTWRALGRHPGAHLGAGAFMVGMIYGTWLFAETGLRKNLAAGI